MKKIKISIIGYGKLGRAIHALLRSNASLAIESWDKKDGGGKMAEVVRSADVIFLCVPSWSVRDALKDIAGYLAANTLTVSLSKGIEVNTSKTIDLVLREGLGSKRPFGLLSGPMLADELSSGKKGFAVFASKSKKSFGDISHIFRKTNLIVEYSSDVRGAAICGVLKNIYALGLGICDGLHLGGNTKGKLASLAIKEMSGIISELGGNKQTVFGDSGAADLIATAFSDFSRNREVGEELARTGVCCLESEGYKSVGSLVKLLGKKYLKFNFLAALKNIVVDNKVVSAAFSALLK